MLKTTKRLNRLHLKGKKILIIFIEFIPSRFLWTTFWLTPVCHSGWPFTIKYMYSSLQNLSYVIVLYSLRLTPSRLYLSWARPGRKQATATEDFECRNKCEDRHKHKQIFNCIAKLGCYWQLHVSAFRWPSSGCSSEAELIQYVSLTYCINSTSEEQPDDGHLKTETCSCQ